MPTVLVIDDHDATRKFLEHICRAHGYTALGVATAEEGMALAEELQPSLVFVDLLLPGKYTGWEAIRLFKNNPTLNHTHVVAMSAGSHLDTALQAGCDAYLSKPFMVEQVLNVLRSFEL